MKNFWLDTFVLLVLIGLGLVVAVIGTIPVLVLSHGQLDSTSMTLSQWLSSFFVFFLPPLIWCRFWKKENAWKAFKFTAPSSKAVLLAIVFTLVSIPFGSATSEVFEMLPFPQSVREYVDNQLIMQMRTLMTMVSGSKVWAIFNGIVLIGLVTGIVEETCFRGAVRKLFSDRWGVHVTAIAVGLVFSLIHFEFYGFFWRWFLGSFYVYLVYYTGSIWTSIIAHALNNSVAMIISMQMLPTEMPVTDAEWLALAKDSEDMPRWLIYCSVVLTAAVLYYFWKNRHDFEKKSPEIAAE